VTRTSCMRRLSNLSPRRMQK